MIKNISCRDVGRIATDVYGKYRVEFVSINRVDDLGNVFCVVKDLKDSGKVVDNFCLIGGCREMNWVEDPAKKLDYPQMTLDISTAVHASRHVNQPRDVKDVLAYLTSEVGECADWLVNPDRRKEDLLGECADVIICALDLALVYKKDTSDLDGQELADEVIGQLNDLLKMKAEKWMDKHA